MQTDGEISTDQQIIRTTHNTMTELVNRSTLLQTQAAPLSLSLLLPLISNSDNFFERKVQVYKNFCVSISQKQCAKFAFGSLAQRRANFVNVSRKVKLQAE